MKRYFNPNRPYQFLRTVVSAALMSAGLVAGSTANANLVFQFDYSGNTAGVGFLEAGPVGQARQNALVLAGSLFSTYFATLFTNSGTLLFNVTSSNAPGPGTLASAGSSFTSALGFGDGEVVRNKLQTGVDLNGAAADGSVDYNWGQPWEIDPNVSVATQNAGNFDFFSTFFHEVTHALGFSSNIDAAGTDGGGDGVSTPGQWTRFDQFMTNCAGDSLIDAAGIVVQPTYNNASTSAMCFVGPNTGSAALYAPNPYSNGSSGSHLDGGAGNYPTAMMKFDRDSDVDEARTYNTAEIGILTDIGYTRVSSTSNSVPEPGSIALVLAGLAGLGAMRRRKV